MANKKNQYLLIGLILITVLSMVGYWYFNVSEEPDEAFRHEDLFDHINDVIADKEYVGSETCRTCHGDYYEEWEGSHHDLAMQEANAETVLADFEDVTYTRDDQEFRFFRSGDSFMVNTKGPEGEYDDFEVIYTFGIEPLQQYLVELPDGKFQALTVAWDVEQEQWYHLNPDEAYEPGDWLHWTGRAFTWNTMCADCHSTNVRKNYDEEFDSFETRYSEIDVGCEACHGPGRPHVEAVEDDDSNSVAYKGEYFDLTSRISPWEQVDQCARCHARRSDLTETFNHRGGFLDHYMPSSLTDGLYHADGQILDEVFVYGSYLQSKMYQVGIACSDCHDSHSLNLHETGNDLCSSCHEPAQYDVYDHHFHEESDAQCVDCHMTGEVYMGIDHRRDHRFGIPRPDQSVEYGVPNACTDCHTHADETDQWAAEQVEEWYGEPDKNHFSDILALGRERDPQHLPRLAELVNNPNEPAIARATALQYIADMPLNETSREVLSQAVRDHDALVRSYAAQVMRNLPLEQKQELLFPLLEDEVRGVRVTAFGSMPELERAQLDEEMRSVYDQVEKEHREMMQAQADHPSSQVSQGSFYQQQGQLSKAEDAFARALKLDPGLNEAKINLAHVHYARQRFDEAQELLEEVVEDAPEYAQGYYSIGLLLSEQGRLAESVEYFEQALELNPNNPRLYYNLGLVHQNLEERGRAEEVFQEGLEQFPQHMDLHYATAVLYVQQNQPEQARPHVEFLLSQQPENARYQNLMRYIQRN